MGGSQGLRHADQQLDHRPQVPGGAPPPVPQRSAIHELCHEVLPAADIADVMNGQQESIPLRTRLERLPGVPGTRGRREAESKNRRLFMLTGGG